MDLIISAALTVVGLVMLCYGGNWLVSGGINIARRLGVSNLVIGITVVAYGTSTPELAASIAASGEHSQVILGNIVGSNIANVGLIIGVSAILVPLVIKKATVRKELFVMIGASVLLIALSVDGEISQYDGALLLVLLVAFTAFTYKSIKKRDDAGSDTRYSRRFYAKSFGMLGGGIALLYVGSELAIEHAVRIAQAFDISERVIGITIIAIGTSLPELITSIMAIRKGYSDIGIGNIVGSNIYNILMIMGVASALAGVAVVDEIYLDYTIMIAFAMVLFALMRAGLVKRWMGAVLAAGYVAYLLFSFLS